MLERTNKSSLLSIASTLQILKCYVWSLLQYNCKTLKQDDNSTNLRCGCNARCSESVGLQPRSPENNEHSCTTETLKMKKTPRPHYGAQVQLIIEGKIEGKYGMGRKRMSWLKNIGDWTQIDGNTLLHKALDRESYIILTANLK